jgi:hypothetical protein
MARTSRRASGRRSSDAEVARDFGRLINMTASQVRAWHRDPRSREASFSRTRAELPLLARMKATPPSRWTPAMWSKARRAVAFVKRHEAQMRDQGRRYGTGALHYTRKRVIALLNWGRRPPGVRVEGL